MPSVVQESSTHASAPARHAPAAKPCPLWAAFGITFLSSLGTGVITTGIYFLTKHAFRFSETENYLLGLLMGITYIAGALGAGSVLRRLRERTGLSARATMAGILIVMGAAAALPIIGASLGTLPKWSIWALVCVYMPLNGTLWPNIEAYLSGGRAGPALRSALGRFNVTWSGALVVGFWLLSFAFPHSDEETTAADPALLRRAVIAIALVGLVHLASLLFLPFVGREPGRHLHDTHEPHPEVYRRLLLTFRVLLPTSYIVSTALNPVLPSILDSLHIRKSLQPGLAGTWTEARVIVFFLLERWHGWHGRWYPAIAGPGVLVVGFAMVLLSPLIAAEHLPAARAFALSGLALFGVAMATIYTAALYYAMEVGQAEVEAGGTHEALIGVGYSGGPTCGLLALATFHAGWTGSLDSTVLVYVAGVALVGGGVAATRALRPGRGVGGLNRP